MAERKLRLDETETEKQGKQKNNEYYIKHMYGKSDLLKYRVPTRSGNREKVGNFVIGREVGKMSGKTKHLKKCCCVGKKVLF